MPRANAQPVRLSVDVLDATKQACVLSGRSLPMEIEYRLKESLQRGSWADIERQLGSNARAFGRLVALMVNELGTHAEPTKEARELKAGELKAAVNYLIDRMYETPKAGSPAGQAEMMTEFWWLRLHNAQERTYENGAPIPMTGEQRALAEIRSDLATGQPAEQPRKRRERE
jgi:hypothetical protein